LTWCAQVKSSPMPPGGARSEIQKSRSKPIANVSPRPLRCDMFTLSQRDFFLFPRIIYAYLVQTSDSSVTCCANARSSHCSYLRATGHRSLAATRLNNIVVEHECCERSGESPQRSRLLVSRPKFLHSLDEPLPPSAMRRPRGPLPTMRGSRETWRLSSPN